jgi:putative Holliday junction resolvase
MRSVGVDLGSKRIGIAVSDSSGTIASPLVVIKRGSNHSQDHKKIQEIINEYEAECVVVGLPLTLAGAVGPAARLALDEIKEMTKSLSVPVHSHDERLTTKTANESMIEANMNAQARRKVVDKIAAAVMLQGWLDHADRLKS